MPLRKKAAKTPKKLFAGPAGRVWGAVNGITHNVPFPTTNCSSGSGAMRGVVMHTEVGFDDNVIREFNNRSAGASAFFSVNKAGHIHQYIPVGLGYYSWAQMDGNREWYSIEFEDGGFPNNPLTDEQIVSAAQLVEFLSSFAGFPLQITDSVTGTGFGVHNMGGQAWGGHTCPDLPPNHVRSRQRPEILSLAHKIRAS